MATAEHWRRVLLAHEWERELLGGGGVFGGYHGERGSCACGAGFATYASWLDHLEQLVAAAAAVEEEAAAAAAVEVDGKACRLCHRVFPNTHAYFHYQSRRLGTLDGRCRACKHAARVSFKDTVTAIDLAIYLNQRDT